MSDFSVSVWHDGELLLQGTVDSLEEAHAVTRYFNDALTSTQKARKMTYEVSRA